MYRVIYVSIISLAALVNFSFAENKDNKIVDHLQDISVTILANGSQGSGVITNVGGVNYVLTAAHVVEGSRYLDVSSDNKKVVRFKDVQIQKDLVEDGRTVGHMQFYAEVIRYSNIRSGEDLAVLRVRKQGLSKEVVKFDLTAKAPPLGTELYHVGSLLGELGSNSLTTGVVSKAGRLINDKIYDQTTCTAFPGSSGGGVFTKDGVYSGMVVRGAGETFNLTVPARRIKDWARKVKVDFILDPSLPVPAADEILKVPADDSVDLNKSAEEVPAPKPEIFNTLIKILNKD